MKSILCLIAAAGALMAESDAVPRLREAGRVFNEIMMTPDKGVPQELLERARCVVIVPGMKKAGLIFGGQYGKGIMTCRNAGQPDGWTGPSTIRVEGGSVGAQIGGGETDVVLVVMNDRGVEKLLKNEFTFGADVAAMAGPVGREASAKTDAYMNAEILSYSRARGLFAGVTLTGSTLRSDDKSNAEIYRRPVRHDEILSGKVAPPAVARSLYASLNRHFRMAVKTEEEGTGTRARKPDRNEKDQ